MKCPVCKDPKLQAVHLETKLSGAGCPKCEGVWIQGRDYHEWLKTIPDKDQITTATDDLELVPVDIKMAKICVVCYRLMGKYKVDELGFTLERCTFCGGIWFDKNEWQALKSCNLHDELNMLLSASHQRLLRERESRLVMENMFKAKFGEANYSELLRVRMWLETHPMRDEMLAYLTDPDPTKA